MKIVLMTKIALLWAIKISSEVPNLKCGGGGGMVNRSITESVMIGYRLTKNRNFCFWVRFQLLILSYWL